MKDSLGSIVTGWRDYLDDDRCDDDYTQPADETPDGPDQGHRYELIVMWDDLTPTESELVASALGALVRRRLPGAVSTYIDHVQ